MASRIVHLAIANEIIKVRPLSAPDRFYFGSLLPDACADRRAHCEKLLENGARKTLDLSGFRRRFGKLVISDSLYLGYYLHLLQDILHRDEMYGTIGFDPGPPENIPQLHLDYELTNRSVIEKYGLQNRVRPPVDLEREPLCTTWQFTPETLLEALAQDFSTAPQGIPRFFTEEDADRLIRRSVELCLLELDALKSDTGYFDEERFAWKRRA